MKVAQPPYGTPMNMSHALSKGMVGCWLLNEGGGLKAFDSTKLNGLPGALLGGCLFATTARGGAILNGAGTPNVSMQAPASYPNLNLSNNMTVSAWINTTTVALGTKCVIGDFNGGSVGQYFVDVNRTAARLSVSWINGSQYILTGTIVLAANTWYHVVYTRSGTSGAWNAALYVNGVTDNTGSTAINPPSANQGTAIGRIGTLNANYFSGNIQTVQLWNRALSHTEVRQLYTNPYQMFIGK